MTLSAAGSAQHGHYGPADSKHLAEQNGKGQKGVLRQLSIDANGNAAIAVPK
jgi:Cu/Zn superoxide dismutase